MTDDINEPDESAQPPPDNVPTKPEYTLEERIELEKLVHVGSFDRTLHYQGTQVEKLLQKMTEVITLQMFRDIAQNLLKDYKRDTYLTKNKHRQATQLLLTFKVVMLTGLGVNVAELKPNETNVVDSAIEQALKLDKFSEWLWREQRASSGKGCVKYVDKFDAGDKKKAS